jgi:alkyl hydroperoxide reductase subunit F
MEFQIDTGFFQPQEGFAPLDSALLYDVLLVGGGPAAMTAAVYCMRKGLHCGVITRQTGGQMRDTHSIENYMGYNYIEGHELVRRFREQVAQFSIALREGAEVSDLTLRAGATGCCWRMVPCIRHGR